MIEASRLWIPTVPGVDAQAIYDYPHTGFHVLLGANNSGKSRLLRALAASKFQTIVLPRSVNASRWLQSVHATVRDNWNNLPELQLTWARTLAPAPTDFSRNTDITLEATSKKARKEIGFNDDLWEIAAAMFWPELRSRRTVFIDTQRYFAPTGNLGGPLEADNPTTWPVILGNLERSEVSTEREVFREIADTFREVTGGLTVRSYGRSGTTIPHIEDPKRSSSRPIAECGDGLRDLVGIVLRASLEPTADLMLDEPGLRLHVETQRRLLKYLESLATHRAVWIATHESVFLGTAAARAHFFVRQDDNSESARVVQLLSLSEARESLVKLGWRPADVLLANAVLLVEGTSDRIAYEAVLSWLSKEASEYSGVVISDLGGDGVVWAKNQTELSKRLELVESVAPYTRRRVLLDSGGRSPEEVERLKSHIRSKNFTVSFLKLPELENYFLSPALVYRIAQDLAAAASAQRGEEIFGPDLGEIEVALGATAPEDKGSNVIESLLKGSHMRFDKVAATAIAVSHLAEAAPEKLEELKQEVKRALEAEP